MSTLIVGISKRWMNFPGSKTDFLLSPLRDEVRQQLQDATTKIERDPKKKDKVIDIKHDDAEFARLVFEKCVHNWRGLPGVVDGTELELEITPEQLIDVPFSAAVRDGLPQIKPLSNWVISTVAGIGIHLDQQVADAGNG